MERLLSESRDRVSTVQFEDKVNEYVALNWPDVDEVPIEDIPIQFEQVQPEGERQISAISASFNEGDTNNECRCAVGDQSWEELVDCLNASLWRDQIIYNLEIMPVNGGAKPFGEIVLQSIQEEQEMAESEQKQPETLLSGSDSDFYSDEVTASLMAGVDLHLELQNYLKAIEGFQEAKSKTKNTLPCNFYDNYVPLKLYSSSQDLQKRAEEYFDVAENRSGTSFDSATSDCPQLEEITNEMLLDVTPATEPEPTATEVDPGKQQQQKDSVKRTAGITSFQVFRLDDKTTWGPSYLHGECTDHTGKRLPCDDYEKLQPLGDAVTATRRKCKTGCLFQNPVTQTEQPPESTPSGKSSTPQKEHIPSWSPTLQELIDIYNSVLKQNTKIRRKSNQSVNRCFSSHLFTFLKEKLREKHCKSELLSLSKEFRMNYKTLSKLGKPLKGNSDLMKLEEYVEMFQEILHSSLSIDQITRLNNTLAGLQDYSEKNYNYVKEEAKRQSKEERRQSREEKRQSREERRQSREAKRQSKEPTPEPVEQPMEQPMEQPVEQPVSSAKVQERPKTAPRKPKKTVRFQTPPKQVKPAQKKLATTERKIRKQQKRRKLKPKPKAKPAKRPVKEKIEKTELPAPTELESVLKLCSKGIALEKEDMIEEKRKILVTVKLQGNQVLVNGISCFKNESALVNEKPEPKGTSELIIENVSKRKTSSDIWWKNTRSNRLRIQNQENTRKRLKKPKKTTKVWKKQTRRRSVDSAGESSEREKTKQEFEYNQVQMRVQHPIGAIAEISESKVSQQVENLEDHWKGEPPPETKILLQDIAANPNAMKEALKAVLDRNVFSKDLCEFGWSEENLGKTVTRKSKRRPAPKKNKPAVVVRSLGDLKKQTPAKTKGQKAPRRGSTYLCYSSLQNIQGKENKKPQRKITRSGSPAKSKPKTKEVCSKTSKEKQRSETKLEASSVLYPTTAPDKLHPPVDESANSDDVDFIFTDEQPEARPTPRESQTIASFDSAASLAKDAFLTPDREPSVALLQSSPCNDCVSIVHQMNHSDSFLGNITSHGVSHTKLQSLFKCSSDLKFYPGRLTESGNVEKPIVTFVLTPTQHEQAQLPENQVKIVKREGVKATKVEDEKKEEIPAASTEPGTEEGRGEISLKSIEEFINYLAKCRKMAEINRKKRIKLEAEQKKLESASVKCCPKTKAPVPGSRLSGGTLLSSRRTFHDSQKKTPAEKNKRRAVKPAVASASKQKPKQKKKVETSDVFLNKIVDNLSRALESLRKEKEGRQKGEAAKPSEKRETKETNTESKGDKATAEPVKHEEIVTEVVEAIKTAIAQTGGSGEMQEITAEFGDERCKTTENVGTECDELPKKLKALKIKIQAVRPAESGEATRPPPQEQQIQKAGEIELLDSLVSKDAEGKNLKRKNSTYFDAVEKDLEVKMGGDANSTNPPTAEGTLNLSLEFGVKEEPKPTLFTPSDERLLSREVLGKDSEEAMYNKIAKALQEGQATYSLALLEAFLSKTDDSDSVRLRNLLALVENRSRNIMMNMERAAWQKVLSLLEEVTEMLNKEDAQESGLQLESTKHFIDKIQLLNNRRLVDLQNFCSSFLTPPSEDETRGNNVIDRIKQSIHVLTQKFTPQRNNPSRDLENLERPELSECESGFKIHSTISLPEIRNEQVTSGNPQKEETQELKRKLQQRYFCMRELLSATGEKSESMNIPQEIRDVKERVAERIKMLERSFEGSSADAPSKESSTYWNKAASLLKLARGCRREEGRSAATGEVRLDRRPGYVDLIKSLMKAWDTRMTIGSIKSECFG